MLLHRRVVAFSDIALRFSVGDTRLGPFFQVPSPHFPAQDDQKSRLCRWFVMMRPPLKRVRKTSAFRVLWAAVAANRGV